MRIKLLFIVAFSLLTACTSDHELGSVKNPIKLFLIPGQDPGVLEDNGNKVAKFLQEKSNLHFEVKVPPSYIAVVEAFGSNRKTFTQPVMVTMFKETGIQKLGFITREDLSEIGITGLSAVYFPTTRSPYAHASRRRCYHNDPAVPLRCSGYADTHKQ